MLQVRADPEEAEGEYQWMAVLTWAGERPTDDIIDEISKKIENYRAKILMFDEWQPRLGYTSGILQVMGGSSKIGERAFFSRENVEFLHQPMVWNKKKSGKSDQKYIKMIFGGKKFFNFFSPRPESYGRDDVSSSPLTKIFSTSTRK